MHQLRAIALASCFVALGCESQAASEQLGKTRDALNLATPIVAKPVAGTVLGSKLNDSLIDRIKFPIDKVKVPIDKVKDPIDKGNDPGAGGENADQPPACSRTALWLQDDNGEPRSCPHLAESKDGRWDERLVFGEKPPLAMARACSYEWRPHDNRPDAQPDFASLKEQLGQFGKIAPELDCPVLSGLSAPDPADVALWEAQRKTALVQAGQATLKPDLFKGKTLVAVIDSAAVPFDQAGPADNFGHGRLVGRIIQDLSCGDNFERCGTEIRNFLALPYLKPEVREPLGGKMGKREDLARAIHAAVDEFARALESGRVTQAVFNLSMGWEPVHGGLEGKPEAFTSASGTVYLALMRAACAGVITVAAAGNAHDLSSTGAVLPGGWESLRGPTARECKRYLRQQGDEVFASEARLRSLDGKTPLVTAVSAVDERDASLGTTRTGATPKFVAYGLSWVTTDGRYSDERAGRTDVLTGTSLSTAVTSAAIADIWAIHPELPVRDVLALLYKSSVFVGHLVREGETATLCGPSSCDKVVRVSVCEATRAAACARGSCSDAPDCFTVPAGGGTPSWSESLFERATDMSLPSAACSTPASDASAMAEPWTHSQPSEGGCVRCALALSSGDLILKGATGALSSSAELFLVTDSGTTKIARPASGYPDALTTRLSSGVSTKRAVLMRNVGSVASPSYLSEDINISD